MKVHTALVKLATQACARRERRKDARPGELLAAALDLFVEKGFAATRVEEVAHRAGVSKGTLFLYFASKEDLFKAVVRENISGRFDEWSVEMANYQGSSTDLLRCCVHSWWERIGATKASGISKLMMSEARNFPELMRFYQEEVIEPGNALVARVLQRGIERGEFRPMDTKYAIHAVMAPMLFLATWKHSFGARTDTCGSSLLELVPDEYIAAHLETLLHGICIQPPAPPASCTPKDSAT